MGNVVTYDGPSDKADPTNKIRIPGEGGRKDAIFRKGVEVEDVHSDVVKVIRDQTKDDGPLAGHEFTIGKSASGSDD